MSEATDLQANRVIIVREEIVAGPDQTVDFWNLSEGLKVREVDQGLKSLDKHLTDLDSVTPELSKKLLERYHENADEFRTGIYGPVHDERHMALVTRWMTEIYSLKKDNLSEDKRFVAGLALAFSAVDHDKGDIPGKGQTLAQSLKREEKSVEKARVFVSNLKREGIISDDQAEEISALSSLLIVATSPSLDMSFDNEVTLDTLQIGSAINAAFRGKEPELKGTTPDQIAEFKQIINASVVTLKNKGWEEKDVQEARKIMTAADYSAYLGTRTVMEAVGLWMELVEPYVDKDGKVITNKPKDKTYLDWLDTPFPDRILDLYSDYLPQEVKDIYQERRNLIVEIQEMRDEEKYDPLYRLEGGLSPDKILEIANKYGFVEDRPDKGVKEVREAVLEYGQNFMTSLGSEKQGFTFLATKAIRKMFQYIPDSRREDFVKDLLSEVNISLQAEGAKATLHIAPMAYALPGLDSQDEPSPELTFKFANLLVKTWNENGGDYSNIAGIGLTVRQVIDHHYIPKIASLSEYIGAGKPVISVGGEITYTGLDLTLKELEELDFTQNIKTKPQVVIHTGYFSENQEVQVRADPVECMDRIYKFSQSYGNVVLHIDRNPKIFLDWLDKLKQDRPSDYDQARNLKLTFSPLAEIIKHPEEIKYWREVVKIYPDAQVTTNNTPSMGGGSAITLVALFARRGLGLKS